MISNEEKEKLIQIALEVRRQAYAPYSQYPVGAALLAASGRIYDGVNVENAAFPVTICAERVAVFKAVSEGEREFTAIVVATVNGGMPCGSCRQVLAEFGLQTLVIIANTEGKIVNETTIGELLPGAFRPQDLPGENNIK